MEYIQIDNEMILRRVNEETGNDLDKLDAQHVEEGNPELVRADGAVFHSRRECSNESCSERTPL